MQKVEELLTPLAQKEGIEIVDVEYVKEDGKMVLRVFIDKESGINMSDCENMSRLMSVCLDESDVLKDSYILEVSSPGIDRALKKIKDFKKFVDNKIKLRTHNAINNQKNFLGLLLSCENEIIKMEDVTNGIVEIEFANIKKANLEPDI